MIQILIYAKATGELRRVIDPGCEVNASAYLIQSGIGADEAGLIYEKQGNGLDTIHAWRAAIEAAQ